MGKNKLYESVENGNKFIFDEDDVKEAYVINDYTIMFNLTKKNERELAEIEDLNYDEVYDYLLEEGIHFINIGTEINNHYYINKEELENLINEYKFTINEEETTINYSNYIHHHEALFYQNSNYLIEIDELEEVEFVKSETNDNQKFNIYKSVSDDDIYKVDTEGNVLS